MANKLQVLRSTVAAARPTGEPAGVPYFNNADERFGIVKVDGSALDLGWPDTPGDGLTYGRTKGIVAGDLGEWAAVSTRDGYAGLAMNVATTGVVDPVDPVGDTVGSGDPFSTVQALFDWVANNIDWVGHLTVAVGVGTFTEVGGLTISPPANRVNVVGQGSGSTTIDVGGSTLQAAYAHTIRFESMTITGTSVVLNCLCDVEINGGVVVDSTGGAGVAVRAYQDLHVYPSSIAAFKANSSSAPAMLVMGRFRLSPDATLNLTQLNAVGDAAVFVDCAIDIIGPGAAINTAGASDVLKLIGTSAIVDRENVVITASFDLSAVGINARPYAGTRQVIEADAPGDVPLGVRAAPLQTAALTQWLDSAADPMLTVTPGGVLTAYDPADGSAGVQARTTLSPNYIVLKDDTGATTISLDSSTKAITVAHPDLTTTIAASLSATALVPTAVPIAIKLAASQTGNSIRVLDSAATLLMRVNAAGNVAGIGAYTDLSDVSTKEVIEDIVEPSRMLDAIQPRRFKRFGSDDYEYGFVAQELMGAVPEAVVDFDEDGLLGVQTGQLIALLVADRAALTARVEALERTVI